MNTSPCKPSAACSAPRVAVALLLWVGAFTAAGAQPQPAADPLADRYTTKTPYQPRQSPDSYQPVPAGFTPVHTQLVARHGARGMTGMKEDLALLNLWRQAKQDQALTPLGEQLGPDLERLLRAQALLGYGVAGIGRPGYGNLSRTGLQEHAQLAQRVLHRLPTLFQAPPAGSSLLVLSSGVDRAVDSAGAFRRALLAAAPQLAPLVREPVLTAYPDDAPKPQAPGVNRFLLYFHKLNAKTDGVSHADDPWLPTWQRSLAYQQYLRGPALADKLAAVHHDPRLAGAARAVLLRLLTPAWVDRLAKGEISASNTGSMSFTSDDGRFTPQLTGDGKVRLAAPQQVLFALSAVYEIAPGLRLELGFDFDRYLTDDAVRLLSELNDAEDFYEKGPGMAEAAPVTWDLATALLQDFFSQADAAGSGKPGASIASLRFTHAEILVPFAARLGVPGMATPLPQQQTYSHANSPWRGAHVAPYAANVQWDTYRNAAGEVLVRMLYNEREADFMPDCEAARHAPGSSFYKLPALKACYRLP